jgi:hypothetical protein
VGAERVGGARELAAAGGAAELGLELEQLEVGEAGAMQAPGGGEASDAAADDGDLRADVLGDRSLGPAAVAQAMGLGRVGAEEGRGGWGGCGGAAGGGGGRCGGGGQERAAAEGGLCWSGLWGR